MHVISWIRQYLLLIIGVTTVCGGVLFSSRYGCETISSTGSTEQNPGEGEAVIYELRAWNVDDWTYGEMALYQSPRDDTRLHRGRVVGIAGDTVEIENGTLRRNGETIEDALPDEGGEYEDLPEILIPGSCLFLIGPRANSPDSRRHGPISIFVVRGKVRE